SVSFCLRRDADAVSSPGLTFSGLTPEDHDLDMADSCQEEQFFQMLAQDIPQRCPGPRAAGVCREASVLGRAHLIPLLPMLLLQETIKHALSLVCRKILGNKKQCQELITKYDNKITQGIMNGKSSEEICVQLRKCSPKIGECGGASRVFPG
ncbi:GNLY protein, partial [Crocuta crocuta]